MGCDQYIFSRQIPVHTYRPYVHFFGGGVQYQYLALTIHNIHSYSAHCKNKTITLMQIICHIRCIVHASIV